MFFRPVPIPALLCALIGACSAAEPSNITILPAKPRPLGFLTRPYQPRAIPPVNLGNSPRLELLIRGGNLYLTAQDVVALALENNIDIETQRYGPLLAREDLRRAQVGGALRIPPRRWPQGRNRSAWRASTSVPAWHRARESVRAAESPGSSVRWCRKPIHPLNQRRVRPFHVPRKQPGGGRNELSGAELPKLQRHLQPAVHAGDGLQPWFQQLASNGQ